MHVSLARLEVLGTRECADLRGSQLSGVIALRWSSATNEWRLDSRTMHRWGRFRARLDAIIFRDQDFRLCRPSRLSLGLLFSPHSICLLLVLESHLSIPFRISMLPLSRKGVLCLSPPYESAGFESGVTSCWRNRAKSCRSPWY